MNEWKELKIDDLPKDILTGDYEWQQKFDVTPNWRDYNISSLNVIKVLCISFIVSIGLFFSVLYDVVKQPDSMSTIQNTQKNILRFLFIFELHFIIY